MDALVISNLYPPHHIGGYELSCRDVVERWRSAGHRVEVLTTDLRLADVVSPTEEPGVRRELTPYWDAERLPTLMAQAFTISQARRIVSPSLRERVRIERHNHRVLERALSQVQPQVVSLWHMGGVSLGLLTRMSGLPMVFVVCENWLVYGPEVDPWTRLFSTRPAAARVARWITGVPTTVQIDSDRAAYCFVSEAVREMSQERSRLPIRRSTVTYSGVDRRDFPSTAGAGRRWDWRLICVGRVEERKGVHVVLEALPHLPPETTLEVLGPRDESYVDGLRKRAAELGVAGRVSFDTVERSDLRKRYRRADAFIFPVLWQEPFGLVPVEAMACGTPVIATGTGGSAEFLVDRGNCLLVPPGDSAAIAGAVRELAADESLRGHVVRGGSLTADELSADRYADVLEAWHLAAAEGFAHGEPEDRSPIREILATNGLV